MKKISICIPTFNRSELLEDLLEGVINLSDPNYEVIVVDNNSTDNTKELLKKGKFKKIKFFQNNENLGMVGNWNRCVELASGDYLIIVHDDDLITSDLLKDYRRILTQYPAVGLIFSHSKIIDENSKELGSYKVLKGNLLFKAPSLFTILLIDNFYHASGVLIKKECYQKLGKFIDNYLLLPDWDMWLRISSKYHAIYIDKPLFLYRTHSKNLSLFVEEKKHLKERLNILKDCYLTLDSNVKNYKKWVNLVELLYRYKLKNYFQRFTTKEYSKKFLRKFVKLNFRFVFGIWVDFLRSFFQKQSIFSTKTFYKSYFYPIWSFTIILRFIQIYINPPKKISKKLYSSLRKLRNVIYS